MQHAETLPASVPASEDIMSYFPLASPRRSQEIVIREIDKAFKEGKRIVILEAPVGSGKSAIAMTFAAAMKSTHVITPRKSLQDQYYEDFQDDIVLMKGRNAYPCTFESTIQVHRKITQAIASGKVRAPAYGEPDCASAPCRNSQSIWERCTSDKVCPYTLAIETAQNHRTVVHNIHSFIFQTNFGGKFEKRDLLIIDEAHEIENVLRDFITKKFQIPCVPDEDEVSDFKTLNDWCDYFETPRFVPEETPGQKQAKENDPDYKSPRDEYLAKVSVLRANHEYYGSEFTVKREVLILAGRPSGVTFEFVPHSIGGAAHRLLFEYGNKVLLMSGTIYDKDLYCKCTGISPSDAYFIRVPSSFPVANRPIYLKPQYQVDTSHRMWDENFGEMIEKISRIMAIFKDVKGLIHAPSYDAMYQIADALKDQRVVTHAKGDLQQSLQMFYESAEPSVFISPVCQQGVDFKGDRARFQIITRVPNPNTNDPFMNYKVQNDFNWYNYQALIVFGQQVGRVNRSDDDFGATFLLDERFNRFIQRNSKKLPKWLQAAFVYK